MEYMKGVPGRVLIGIRLIELSDIVARFFGILPKTPELKIRTVLAKGIRNGESLEEAGTVLRTEFEKRGFKITQSLADPLINAHIALRYPNIEICLEIKGKGETKVSVPAHAIGWNHHGWPTKDQLVAAIRYSIENGRILERFKKEVFFAPDPAFVDLPTTTAKS